MDAALRIATFKIGKLPTYDNWPIDKAAEYLENYCSLGLGFIHHPKSAVEKVQELWRLSKQAQ